MTNKQKRFFNIAREVSFLGDYKKARIGAVVVEGNRIISTGHNSNKTSTIQFKYNAYRGITNSPPKLHAEIAALAPLINKKNIEWSKVAIYVYRELRDGTISCARPCQACMKLIKDLGIKNVYYSDWNGDFIREENLNES